MGTVLTFKPRATPASKPKAKKPTSLELLNPLFKKARRNALRDAALNVQAKARASL